MSDDPPSEGILTAATAPGRAPHQDCVMRNGSGLVGYVGGIDINLNRINSAAHHDYAPGLSPYHDVQCKVEGPAARDVLRTAHLALERPPGAGLRPEPPVDAVPSNGKTSELSCPALGVRGAAS